MRKKIIYLIGGAALVSLIVVFSWLWATGRIKPFAAGTGGSISLSPSSGTITVGQNLTVSILANSAGQEVTGVDIRYLHYNTSDFELQGQVQKGSLFSNYSTASDTTAGTISISGTISGGEAQKAVSGVLATMTFKALKVSTTQLTFDYDPANPTKTTDTNMVRDDGAGNIGDILEQVTGGTYTLQAAVAAPAPTATPTPTPVSAPAPPGGRMPTPTPTPTPPAQTQPTPEEVTTPTEETPTVSEPTAEETPESGTAQTQTPSQVAQTSPGATTSPTVSPKVSPKISPKTSPKTSPAPTKIGGFSVASGLLLYIGIPVIVTLIIFFIWQKIRKKKNILSKPPEDDEDELI